MSDCSSGNKKINTIRKRKKNYISDSSSKEEIEEVRKIDKIGNEIENLKQNLNDNQLNEINRTIDEENSKANEKNMVSKKNIDNMVYPNDLIKDSQKDEKNSKEDILNKNDPDRNCVDNNNSSSKKPTDDKENAIKIKLKEILDNDDIIKSDNINNQNSFYKAPKLNDFKYLIF